MSYKFNIINKNYRISMHWKLNSFRNLQSFELKIQKLSVFSNTLFLVIRCGLVPPRTRLNDDTSFSLTSAMSIGFEAVENSCLCWASFMSYPDEKHFNSKWRVRTAPNRRTELILLFRAESYSLLYRNVKRLNLAFK